jgi:hypothetical protein
MKRLLVCSCSLISCLAPNLYMQTDKRSDSPVPSATRLTRSASINSKKPSLLNTSSVRVQVNRIGLCWCPRNNMLHSTEMFLSIAPENADCHPTKEIGTVEITS